MYKKLLSMLSLSLVILLTACSAETNNSFSTSSSSALSESISTPAQSMINSNASELESRAALLSETDEYREYLITAGLYNIEQEVYASLRDTGEQYQYIIKVPKELEIVYPKIVNAAPRPIDDPNKTADLWPCVQLKDEDQFSDIFENFDSDYFGAFQIDKGSYQGELGNTIYYDVLEFYEGGFTYSYGFLAVLDEGIAAGFTFYSWGPNRLEDEANYRAIVETATRAE